MTPAHRLAICGLAALALTSACTAQADRDAKARMAASYTAQCNEAAARSPNLTRLASRYCSCVANGYVTTFSAVQIPLIPFSKPLRDAAEAITRQCGLIAMAQEEYNRVTAALRARSNLAVTAYLTPDFVSIDLSGRKENARQLLSRIESRPNAGVKATAVLSVEATGKRMIVKRTSVDVTDRKGQALETQTFFTDTWIDTDGTWLLRRSKADRMDSYVDGRHVSQSSSRGF
jgi:hypothetical protein